MRARYLESGCRRNVAGSKIGRINGARDGWAYPMCRYCVVRGIPGMQGAKFRIARVLPTAFPFDSDDGILPQAPNSP